MNIYKQAVAKFGIEKQLIKLAEECSELAQASCKQHLYGDNLDNLAEEIVDVVMVITQITEHYDMDALLAKYDDLKIHKLRKLLAEEVENG
jgi:NTP pyrophosphatase (non-canonical NTP hydrolase)